MKKIKLEIIDFSFKMDSKCTFSGILSKYRFPAVACKGPARLRILVLAMRKKDKKTHIKKGVTVS